MATALELYTTKSLMDCLTDYLKPLTGTCGYPEPEHIDSLVENHAKIEGLCDAISDRLSIAVDSALVEEARRRRWAEKHLNNTDLAD